MNDSLSAHGGLTESSRTNSLTTPIGKGREGNRKGNGVGHLAFLTTEGATCEVPANATDPTTRQCEETCPVLADLKLQLRGARLALSVLRDALAAERAGA